MHVNYAAIDPALTNAKCSYWHFAWDANSDIKVEALTNFIKPQKDIKKVYLIDQDYSFGHAVADAADRMLKAKRPDIQIVGNEFHPLVKVTDFSPYVAKIKASGADTVITGNWGQDFALLIKAAADAGLHVNWYTFYAGGAGGPTAVRQANEADHVFQITEGFSNLGYKPAQDIASAYAARYNTAPVYYPRLFTAMGMVFKAIDETKSDDPVKIAHALEGMNIPTSPPTKKGSCAGRPPVLRTAVHLDLRPARINGAVRRRAYRLGLEAGGADSRQGHHRSHHLQNESCPG